MAVGVIPPWAKVIQLPSTPNAQVDVTIRSFGGEFRFSRQITEETLFPDPELFANDIIVAAFELFRVSLSHGHFSVEVRGHNEHFQSFHDGRLIGSGVRLNLADRPTIALYPRIASVPPLAFSFRPTPLPEDTDSDSHICISFQLSPHLSMEELFNIYRRCFPFPSLTRFEADPNFERTWTLTFGRSTRCESKCLSWGSHDLDTGMWQISRDRFRFVFTMDMAQARVQVFDKEKQLDDGLAFSPTHLHDIPPFRLTGFQLVSARYLYIKWEFHYPPSLDLFADGKAILQRTKRLLEQHTESHKSQRFVRHRD